MEKNTGREKSVGEGRSGEVGEGKEGCGIGWYRFIERDRQGKNGQ